MKRSMLIFFLSVFLMPFVNAQDDPIRYEFSAKTAEENKVTLQGAGFGEYPMASVSFSYLPTDNAFEGATDGQGAVITAQPGEGVMVFGERITTTNVAMIRCSLRTEQTHASVTIASIGSQPDEFIATNHPNNESYFAGQYMRIATFCIPPSAGFQPVIQIINTSETELLTAYLDNFEIYLLDPNKYYSTTFLDGDETDPPADQISVPSKPGPGAVSTPSDLKINVGKIDVFIEMVLIPAGTFTMGSPSSEKHRRDDEGPQHQVTITEPFYMGKYEVTQAQWRAVMGTDPSYFKGDYLPVELVSWDDCQAFINKLNQMGQGTFRLPTEAEWEYACRAGTTTAFYWGEDSDYSQIGDYAWYKGNSGGHTHNVGLKLPNAFGLFDMTGNVWEWCQDWWGEDYYTEVAQIDPTGASSGSFRVNRGGYWSNYAKYCRLAIRGSFPPDGRHYGMGLRLLRSYP